MSGDSAQYALKPTERGDPAFFRLKYRGQMIVIRGPNDRVLVLSPIRFVCSVGVEERGQR